MTGQTVQTLPRIETDRPEKVVTGVRTELDADVFPPAVEELLDE
ncbi:hypothetical protein VB779_17625 [Haloarculaceae archaeon H-GB11]|nr:hypothetical protein [Haloarculaceae archaeon H-GB11]